MHKLSKGFLFFAAVYSYCIKMFNELRVCSLYLRRRKRHTVSWGACKTWIYFTFLSDMSFDHWVLWATMHLYYLLCESVFYYGLPGMTQLMRKFPIALTLIFVVWLLAGSLNKIAVLLLFQLMVHRPLGKLVLLLHLIAGEALLLYTKVSISKPSLHLTVKYETVHPYVPL